MASSMNSEIHHEFLSQMKNALHNGDLTLYREYMTSYKEFMELNTSHNDETISVPSTYFPDMDIRIFDVVIPNVTQQQSIPVLTQKQKRSLALSKMPHNTTIYLPAPYTRTVHECKWLNNIKKVLGKENCIYNTINEWARKEVGYNNKYSVNIWETAYCKDGSKHIVLDKYIRRFL